MGAPYITNKNNSIKNNQNNTGIVNIISAFFTYVNISFLLEHLLKVPSPTGCNLQLIKIILFNQFL